MKTTMKLTLAALTALALTANAYAAGITASVIEQKKVSFCESVANLAGLVMQLRQANAPLAELLRNSNGRSVFTRITLAAYESPAYSTAEIQKREIVEFANTHMLECLKNPQQYRNGSE